MTTITTIPTINEIFVDPRAIPTPPISVLEILRRADDPDVSMAEIAGLIEADVGITVQVLRLANSALYSMGREITTVNRALAALGLRTIKLIALTTSVRTLIPQHIDAFDTGELRRRMTVTAGVARRAADLFDRSVAEEAFVAGLLTGLGPVVLAARAPIAARAVFEGSAPWPDADRQRDVLGYTFDDVSRELLARWGLPPVFGDAIASRHDENDHSSPVAASVALASATVPVLTGHGDQVALARLRRIIERAEPKEDVDDWIIGCEPVVLATASSLEFRIPHDVAFAELLELAEDRLLDLQNGLGTAFLGENAEIDELERRNDELEVEATTDALTGLPNRRAFDRAINAMIERRTPTVGLLMIDLDDFKAINDSHGHSVGDDVLRAVGTTLRSHTRGDDFTARYGGEEFTMLIPETDNDRLHTIGDRLRQAIAAIAVTLDDGSIVSVTASVGGAVLDRAGGVDSARDLVEAADAQLYAVKRDGRNQTRIG